MTKRRSKVLFLLPSLAGGGAERVFLTLLRRIDREHIEPILILGRRMGELCSEIPDGLPTYELGNDRARRAIISLARLIRREEPDVVFSTLGMNFAALIANYFIRSKARFIIREASSSSAFLKDVERRSRFRHAIYVRLYRWLYRTADKIICQSDYMARDLASNFTIPPEKLIQIANPVDFERLDAWQRERNPETRVDDSLRLVMVGRHSWEKGIDVLLRAIAIARKVQPAIKLDLIGHGDLTSELMDLTMDLGLRDNVRFLGFQAEPARFMAKADAVVVPSRYEALSNVMLEALAMGVPVVATDCPGGNSEVVIDGVNGFLVPSEDEEQLASLFVTLGDRLRMIDRDVIQKDFQERFAIERIIDEYQQIFGAA